MGENRQRRIYISISRILTQLAIFFRNTQGMMRFQDENFNQGTFARLLRQSVFKVKSKDHGISQF